MHRWLPAMIMVLGVGLFPGRSVHATSLGTTDTVTSCSGDPTVFGSLPYEVAHAAAGDTVAFALDCTGASPITLTSWIQTTATPLTIDGSGHQIDIDGGGTTSVIDVPAGNTLTLRDLTISHAGGTVLYPTEGAGAVYSEGTLTVSGCTFVNNTPALGHAGSISVRGAAIDEEETATSGSYPVTIDRSYFKDNGTTRAVVYSFTSVATTITNSTFDSNGANIALGAVVSMGPTNNTLTNDTFFNNVVGIELVDVSGSGTITSSTFAFNTSGGPLFVSETAGNISIGSDIIDGGFQNYCGANIDLGYNAWYNFPGSECNLSSANHDALGPLGLAFGVSNNGGPVPTDPISAGSAAINLVPIGSLCPATDARGYFRPGVGESNCTAGAYEYNAAPPWYVRQFSAGWNLVSVPLQGAATSASSLSSSLNAAAGDTVVSVVSTYANGRFSLYVPGYSADLSLQPAQGVFVRSSAAFTSQPSGALYNTGQAVTLLPGWNLVAAPYPSAGLMTNTVASEASACNVQEVATYSAGSYSTWTPAMGAAAAFLVPATSGMWIECATAASWTPS